MVGECIIRGNNALTICMAVSQFIQSFELKLMRKLLSYFLIYIYDSTVQQHGNFDRKIQIPSMIVQALGRR